MLIHQVAGAACRGTRGNLEFDLNVKVTKISNEKIFDQISSHYFAWLFFKSFIKVHKKIAEVFKTVEKGSEFILPPTNSILLLQPQAPCHSLCSLPPSCP